MDSTAEHPDLARQRRRLLVGLLVAAMVALSLVVLGMLKASVSDHPYGFPDGKVVMGVLGLCLGQIALMTAWVVLGGVNVVIRVLCLLAGVIYWSAGFLVADVLFSSWPEGGGALLLFAGATAAPLVAGRLVGVTVGVPAPKPGDDRASRQFTIFGLFSLMTAVAILVWATRWAEFHLGPVQAMVAFLSTYAAVFLIALWAPLRFRSTIVATILVVLTVPLSAFIAAIFLQRFQRLELFGLLLILFGTEAICITAAAFVLRAAGYRALWRGRWHGRTPAILKEVGLKQILPAHITLPPELQAQVADGTERAEHDGQR